MSAFTSRKGGYKFGVFFLLFACVVFFAGFAAPYWAFIDIELNSVSYQEGLWSGCTTNTISTPSTTKCVSLDKNFKVIPGWFHGVRTLECCCLLGLFIACIYILATNCCKSMAGPRTRILEVLAGGSGLLGFNGCMMYVGFYVDKKVDTSVTVKALKSPTDVNVVYTASLDWAFYMAAVGSVLCVVAAVIIFVYNIEIPVATSAVGYGDGVVIAMSNVPVQAPPQANNQQFYGHSQPAAYPPPKAGQEASSGNDRKTSYSS